MDETGDVVDIGHGTPREIARATLVLTEAGITFEASSTEDLQILLHLCEVAASGVKQVMFQGYLRQKSAVSNGLVTDPGVLLQQLKRHRAS